MLNIGWAICRIIVLVTAPIGSALSHMFKKPKMSIILLCSVIFGTAYNILDPYVQAKIENIKMNNMRPSLSVQFLERSDSEVVVELFHEGTNTTTVEDISIKFDIPGEYITHNIDIKDKTGDYSVFHSLLSGIGDDITAETVSITAKSLLPGGLIRIEIKYRPTREFPYPGSDEYSVERYFMPLLDLHDYSPCNFTWLYGGKKILETNYIPMIDLNYIQLSNQVLLRNYRAEEYFEDIGENSLSDSLVVFRQELIDKYSESWLLQMEEDRKDW